jgi:hypothetical protein
MRSQILFPKEIVELMCKRYNDDIIIPNKPDFVCK